MVEQHKHGGATLTSVREFILMEIMAKLNCQLCEKAVSLLSREPGITVEVKYDINPDIMVDFAEMGKSPISFPLIRAYNSAGVVIRYWDGEDCENGLLPLLRQAQATGWKLLDKENT